MSELPIIFTKHAEARMRLRRISAQDVAVVLAEPDRHTLQSDPPDSVKFVKTINNRPIHVIATHLTKKNKWLIISVWVRGEDDPLDPITASVLWIGRQLWQGIRGLIRTH